MRQLIKKFIDYIENQKNYSKNTVKSYKEDLDQFYRFLKEEKIDDF
jgi:site-specific recombinase XerD